MALTAEMMWEGLKQERPEIFGEENPFNDEIRLIQEQSWGLYKCSDPLP